MPIDLKNSVLVQNQRNLLVINKTIENLKGNRRNLENEKIKLISKFPQLEIAGRIESLNKIIDIVNEKIGKLQKERNKIEIQVPEK